MKYMGHRITSVSHVLKVNEYGERQAKGNEKNLCFKGWETLVKKIPDTTTDRSYILLKAKVNDYSEDEQTQLVNLALKYSPLTRALLGSMLTNDYLAATLFQTLSPLTRFRVGLSPTLVSSQWNIQ